MDYGKNGNALNSLSLLGAPCMEFILDREKKMCSFESIHCWFEILEESELKIIICRFHTCICIVQ